VGTNGGFGQRVLAVLSTHCRRQGIPNAGSNAAKARVQHYRAWPVGVVTDPVLDWGGRVPLRLSQGNDTPMRWRALPASAGMVRTAWARGRSLVCLGLCEAVHPTSAWACAGEVE
jgi:hypothetical protein